MRIVYTFILLLLFPHFSFSQPKTYEIFGNIKGEYKGKVHLIFDKITATNDTLISEIKNGQFNFSGTVPRMPILAIFRLSDHSTFAKVYIDSSQTYIDFTNELKVQGNNSSQLFQIASISGSATGSQLLNFEKKKRELIHSDLSDEKKMQVFNEHLSSFIRQHPKSKVSAFLLGQAYDLSYKQAKENSELIDASLHESTEWSGVERLLDELYKPQFINTSFYEVNLKDPNNKTIRTESLRGKLTLIVLWASWCLPCRAEHPDFNRFYQNYGPKGLQIIGVSLDKSKEAWIKAVKKDNLTWPQLIDEKAFDGDLAKHYGIRPLPANFLLDQHRNIIGVDLTVKEIEEFIKKLLP